MDFNFRYNTSVMQKQVTKKHWGTPKNELFLSFNI